MLGEAPPAPADGVVTRPAGGVGADLEPRGVDDAVDRVLDAGHDDAGLGDALDAPAVGVHQVGVRGVSVEVLVVEARALAQLAVPTP